MILISHGSDKKLPPTEEQKQKKLNWLSKLMRCMMSSEWEMIRRKKLFLWNTLLWWNNFIWWYLYYVGKYYINLVIMKN